jgi:hypothetical protein
MQQIAECERKRAGSIYSLGALWLHSWEEEMMTAWIHTTLRHLNEIADFYLMLTVCGGVLRCADFLEN